MSREVDQIEILDELIFGNAHKRIQCLSEEKHDVLMTKMNEEAKNGFPNSSRFELRYFMWWQLSLKCGFAYQPAESAGEHAIEEEVDRDFWKALKAYIDKKGE